VDEQERTERAPRIDRAGIARLAQEAAAAARAAGENPETLTGKPGPQMWSTTARPDGGPGKPGESERRMIGRQERMACPDCGMELAQELRPLASWAAMWFWPEHHCQEGEARRQREAEQREQDARAAHARHLAWLADPPPQRVEEVRRRVGLPGERVVPAGLIRIIPEMLTAGGQAALALLRAHRETWERGERPEKGLWLWGRTNRRKTVLTGALAFDVAHRTGRRVLFWNASRLMEEKAKAARGERHRWDQELLDDADLLVLDDLGTLNVTSAAWKTVYGIIESASAGWGGAPSQVLYVTSNESPAQLAALLSPADHPDGGERILRRLVQLCDVVALDEAGEKEQQREALRQERARRLGVER
jgi:DNA replication protein DnaC